MLSQSTFRHVMCGKITLSRLYNDYGVLVNY